MVAAGLAATPSFRGKGRLVLFLDGILTDPTSPASYLVEGELNGGVRFCFDLRAWGQKFAFYYRRWEHEYVRMVNRLYRGGVFLDIGSSLGLYPVCMGGAVRARGERIISVEPVENNLDRQRINVALNGLEDLVTFVPVALGDRVGVLRIRTDPTGADNNAVVTEEGDIEVPVRRLDGIMEEIGRPEVGFVKMDVEGYEPSVLRGATEILARDRPFLLAEFNRERMAVNGFDMGDSWELLHGFGYECYALREGRNALRLLDTPSDVENLFFLPREYSLPADLLG